ncbi:MAG: tyrosine-type recombinase/integrase [Paraclostridium sp.]
MNNYNIKSSFIRKRGNNYNVIIEFLNDEGKLKQKSLGKYENKKDAEKHLIDLKSLINNNRFIINKDITFIDRYLQYLNDESKNFSPLTKKKSRENFKVSIEPFFKETLLKDITPFLLQTYINKMYLEYAKSTAKMKVSLVKAVLNEAYRLKEIHENPCFFVKAPNIKKSSTTIEPFSKEEAKIVIKKLEGRFFEVPLLLMLTMGLRGEEVCGLKWKDIDLDEHSISIKQVLINVDGVFIFKNPKTESSIRTVSAPSELIKKLEVIKCKHDIYKSSGILEKEFEDLVCLNSKLGPYSTRTLWENFTTFLKKHNIRKIRLHDLRHTHATLLVLAGVDFKTISHRLGHGDIKITLNRYSHVLDEMDKKASDNISKTLFM